MFIPSLINLFKKQTSVFCFQGVLYHSLFEEKKIYWLGDCTSAFNDKKYKKFFSLLAEYKGPHTILLFLSSQKKNMIVNGASTITVPEKIGETEFIDVVTFFKKKN